MTISDWITFASAAGSLILAWISYRALWSTLEQNKIMLENSTRPYVAVKCEAIVHEDGVVRYVVVKNYGKSAAKIEKMQCTGTADPELMGRVCLLTGTTLAPGQRVIYYIGGPNPGEPEEATFDYCYRSPEGTVYEESTDLNLIVGTVAMRAKGELSVSYALQDIADRLL